MRIEAVAGGPGHATNRCIIDAGIIDAGIIDVRITGVVVTCTRRRSTNQRESKSEQSGNGSTGVQTTPANGRLSPLRGENLVRLGLLRVWGLVCCANNGRDSELRIVASVAKG